MRENNNEAEAEVDRDKSEEEKKIHFGVGRRIRRLSRRKRASLKEIGCLEMVDVIEEQTDLQDVNQNVVFSDATPFEGQVGGHSGSSHFLSHKDGYVLKPVLKGDERGEREVRFYEEVRDSCDPFARELNRFVPKYFGTTKAKGGKEDTRWMVLANAAHGFAQACIMDVKIGAQTWDPLAGEEKRRSEERKYRECKRDLGFCIPGFQVYKLPSGELIKKDKEFGKSLDGETAKDALKTFLNGEFGLSRSLVLQFLAKLWKILRWFRTQTKYRFYSSSLLLVYDAAKLKQLFRNGVNYSARKSEKPTIGRQLSLRIATGPLTPGFSEECKTPGSSGRSSSCSPTPGTPGTVEDWHTMFDNACRTHSLVNNYEKDLQTMKENYSLVLKDLTSRALDQYEVWVNVHMIDFAHVFHSNAEEPDKNYLNGLQNLVNIFEEFLVEAEF